MSYSVKLADEILISGFSAIQPNYIFSHQQVIAKNKFAENQPDNSVNFVMNTGELPEVAFDLTTYIGRKGLRFHDRSSKLILAAIKAVLDETKLLERYSRCDINLIVGSDGALQSQNDVVREAMLTPKMVNPKAYPNRGCNVIAGQASLMFGLLGESTVISSGYRSGIDALIYAVRKILVASRPVSYIVAAGEALSGARSWRKKYKTCADDYGLPIESLPIEGAVALTVERSINSSPHANQGYQVIGYQQISDSFDDQQGQKEKLIHANDFLQKFLFQLGYPYEAIDTVIVGLEDRIDVQTKAGSYGVPYDVFGATGLLQLLETIGLNHAVNGDAQPQTIALSQSDQQRCMSMLLLRRKPD